MKTASNMAIFGAAQLLAKLSDRHAALHVSRYIPENYRADGGADVIASVLLFESKLTAPCSTSHIWMAPGDIFQHCASARDLVRIFMTWSKETSSPTQIHENHGPEKMLRSGVSSTLSATTDTLLGTILSSYK